MPAIVWSNRLAGYQVLKEWLPYRETNVLGRALKVEEVGYLSEVAKRIRDMLLTATGEQ